MASSEHAADAVARAKRQLAQAGATPVTPPPVVTAAELNEDPDGGEVEVAYYVLPESVASQIGSANLEDGDVVLYLNPVFLTKDAVCALSEKGPTALMDRVNEQSGHFVLAREQDIADVVKGMIEAAIVEARK